jgi:hypothetical protein
LVSLEHPMEIRTGMVFALETYCPASDGFSAARIEEEVVVTNTGHAVITRFPAEDLPIAMLTEAAIATRPPLAPVAGGQAGAAAQDFLAPELAEPAAELERLPAVAITFCPMRNIESLGGIASAALCPTLGADTGPARRHFWLIKG